MNNDQYIDNEYLGITEAAEYLRVSASTLRRWEKKGFLVPERTPTGIRRYTRKQLDDVIQSPHDIHSYSPSQEHHVDELHTQEYAEVPNDEYILHEQVGHQESPLTTEDDTSFDTLSRHASVEAPDATVESLSPASDDEVDQLRDFFKKAGYETSSEISNVPHAVAPSEVANSAQPYHEQVLSNPHPDYNLISLQDIIKEEIIAPVDNDSEKQDSPAHNETPPIPVTPTFSSMIGKSTTEAILPHQTTSNKIEDERIEIFHEEHSVQTPPVQPQKYESSEIPVRPTNPQPQQIEDHHAETSYHSTPSERPQHKNNIVLYIIIVVAFVAIAAVIWLAYSYFSSPAELYSPIVE